MPTFQFTILDKQTGQMMASGQMQAVPQQGHLLRLAPGTGGQQTVRVLDVVHNLPAGQHPMLSVDIYTEPAVDPAS